MLTTTKQKLALPLSNDKTEDDGSSTILLEQQMAWEDATTDTPANIQVESILEPTLPLDQLIICDIQKIAGLQMQTNL